MVIVILAILMIILPIIGRRVLDNISESLRKDIFNKIYSLDYLSFTKKESSFYISMMTNDVQMLEELYFNNILEIIDNVVCFVVVVVTITTIGWQYTCVILLFSLFTIIQPFILKKKLAKDGVEVSNKNTNYVGCVKETINGFDVIKGVGNSKNFVTRLNNSANVLENSKLKLANTKVLNSLLAALAVNLLRAGGQMFFINSTIKGVLDIASVAILLNLINQVASPISCLLSYIEPMNSTKDVQKKIIDFLNMDTKNNADVLYENKFLNKKFEKICFENVSFSYDGENNNINNLNLSIESGKKYAIVGESGCGKSTVIKMIMGYYDNYEGKIILNKKDSNYTVEGCFNNNNNENELRKLNKKEYRKNISYITQTAYIFDDTIENNITLGNCKYSKKQLDDVIDYMQLRELYEKIKDGEYSIKDLSGGEKQRISLARAIIADNDLILMDESTSALDNITSSIIEKRILENKDKTVIAIIHRFNESISLYDKFLYMENGQIVETGTFDELMARKGKVYKMVTGKESAINEEND